MAAHGVMGMCTMRWRGWRNGRGWIENKDIHAVKLMTAMGCLCLVFTIDVDDMFMRAYASGNLQDLFLESVFSFTIIICAEESAPSISTVTAPARALPLLPPELWHEICDLLDPPDVVSLLEAVKKLPDVRCNLTSDSVLRSRARRQLRLIYNVN
ncbi:hypothetical protein DL93DRAFT_1793785 [Clavulina sp. PMI_390]|nr:hypothetical protein DL93DRAFT_1793785 [Clavulina sp. PMI_390]